MRRRGRNEAVVRFADNFFSGPAGKANSKGPSPIAVISASLADQPITPRVGRRLKRKGELCINQEMNVFREQVRNISNDVPAQKI
jgi:hypothetical protein